MTRVLLASRDLAACPNFLSLSLSMSRGSSPWKSFLAQPGGRTGWRQVKCTRYSERHPNHFPCPLWQHQKPANLPSIGYTSLVFVDQRKRASCARNFARDARAITHVIRLFSRIDHSQFDRADGSRQGSPCWFTKNSSAEIRYPAI